MKIRGTIVYFGLLRLFLRSTALVLFGSRRSSLRSQHDVLEQILSIIKLSPITLLYMKICKIATYIQPGRQFLQMGPNSRPPE